MALSVGELGIAMIAVIIGAVIQGSMGFGLGLVAAPVLVMIDARLVPGVILGIGVPLTYLIAWRERRSLDLRRVSWAVAGRIPGTVAGSAAVLVLSQRSLAAMFAFALLAAVGLSIAGISLEPSRQAMLGAGLGSGFMGTSTSVGGPPIALLLQHEQGPELRASIAAFMAFGSTFSLVALIAIGKFGRSELVTTAALVPTVLVGFWLSRWTNRYLDRGHTRLAVLTFATLSALSILFRQVV